MRKFLYMLALALCVGAVVAESADAGLFRRGRLSGRRGCASCGTSSAPTSAASGCAGGVCR